jgi:hypothetical protein
MLPDQATMAQTIAMSLDSLRSYATSIDIARDEDFACDLAQAKNRIRLAPRHPVLDSSYVIDTGEVRRFYDVVYDYILARKSGLYIYGKYRVGKSKAIEYSISELEALFPFMAFAVFDGERNPHQHKSSFCRDVLESWNYPWQQKQNSSKVLERYMMTRAVQAGGRVFVLFVDEAQMLTVMHYRYLLETWNALRTQGFILVTILVGQESLQLIAKLTQEEDHGAVVARFFTKAYAMGGLRSEEELGAYLRAYDEKLVYPAGSGWSYSRFFLQKAYDSGWRLTSSSATLWTLMKETLKPGARELLQHGFRLDIVTDTIHNFLLDAMQTDASEFTASRERWAIALAVVVDDKGAVS